jgi:adenylate cyclase
MLRGSRPDAGDDPRVVIVQVSERDIQELGYPLSDEILARALRALVAAGARAVGVDLYRDRPVPPGAEALERVVLESPHVVLVEKVGGDGEDSVRAPAFAVGSGQVGFSDVAADADGRLRRALLMMHHGGVGGLSLAARLAFQYLAAEQLSPRWERSEAGGDPIPTLRLGEAPVPRARADDGSYVRADVGGYQILLAHPRGRTRFATLGLGELLAGRVAPEQVRDRVVIVGTVAASVPDRHETPFGEIAGVEYHAAVVSELLDRALARTPPVRFLGDASEAALVVLCAVLGAALPVRLRSPWGLAAGMPILLALLALGSFGLFRAGWWWLPSVPGVLACGGAGAVSLAFVSWAERQDRQRVLDLFGRFLAPRVADSIWKARDSFLDGGRPRARVATITVMMTDLVGYTSVSERFDAPQLVEWIDEYLEAMAQLVGVHGGVVDDYAGDGIKADFGVPIPRGTDAEICADAVAAVECALAMEGEVERLNRRWATRGFPPARVRVGLHTGPAVVGVIGGSQRLKFTSMGDTVNTAARLESYRSEEFRGEEARLRVLVSAETFRRLGGRYEAEALGNVVLKGKAEPVPVHRIRGRAKPEEEEGLEPLSHRS